MFTARSGSFKRTMIWIGAGVLALGTAVVLGSFALEKLQDAMWHT
jgi:hypothetical protein